MVRKITEGLSRDDIITELSYLSKKYKNYFRILAGNLIGDDIIEVNKLYPDISMFDYFTTDQLQKLYDKLYEQDAKNKDIGYILYKCTKHQQDNYDWEDGFMKACRMIEDKYHLGLFNFDEYKY